jgi:hypothetical protein
MTAKSTPPDGHLLDDLTASCAPVETEVLHGVRAITTPGIVDRLEVVGEFGDDSLPNWPEPIPPRHA